MIYTVFFFRDKFPEFLRRQRSGYELKCNLTR